MDSVRLALVGCGKMGQSVHLPNFLRASNCSVVAVCDRLGDLAREVARAHSIPQHFDSIAALTKGVQFDAAAAIAHWTLNSEMAVELLSAGKHVYVEKPIAPNSEEAQRMVECAKANGAKLMVAYMKRYDPGCQKAKQRLKDALSSGEMGRITYARFHDFMGDWICGYDLPVIAPKGDVKRPDPTAGVPDFVKPSERQAYATLNSVFCHDINLMRYFLGDPNGVRYSRRRGITSVTVFDYGDFDCTFETGMIPRLPFDEGARINFEKGWIRVDVHAPLRTQSPATVTVCRDGSIETLAPEWGWSFSREAQHFIDCILKDESPLSSGEDSAKDLTLVEEMYKAHLAALPEGKGG